jgi:hypothetical protein
MPIEAATHTHDVIIAEVAERMRVPEQRLRARDRSPQVCAARHAAFWALNQAGLIPAQIARLLGLNHATVVHGLARAEQHPEWRALVAPVVELAGAGGQRQAVRSWLSRGLREQPAETEASVHAYVTCTLLGWSLPFREFGQRSQRLSNAVTWPRCLA